MQRNIKKTKKRVLNGRGLHIGIVVAQFNRDITEKMLKGALSVLAANNVQKKNIKVVRVPGSVEIPLACQMLAKKGGCDGLVAIGCVIKGETEHDYYVASIASQGILRVSLDHGVPIGFGVITVNTLEQARARAEGGMNKGAEAAETMLEMVKAKQTHAPSGTIY